MTAYNLASKGDFERVRSDAEILYRSLKEIYCPYFNEKITFNAKGLEHIKFKAHRYARPRSDQYMRFKLLHFAPEVIRKSHTVQGVWESRIFEVASMNSRWERVLKNVAFWEFVAVLEDVRVRVIVKEVEGGSKHFWSIIPFWKVDGNAKRRVLHSGKPESD